MTDFKKLAGCGIACGVGEDGKWRCTPFSVCAVCGSPIPTEKENTSAPAVIPEDLGEQSRATAIAVETRNAISDSAPIRVCASCENETQGPCLRQRQERAKSNDTKAI